MSDGAVTHAIDQEGRRLIKNFSVLYVGNIDLEDVGADGTPADQRRYTNDRLMESLDTATRRSLV